MSGIFNLFGRTNVTPRAQKMCSTDLMGKLSSSTPPSGGGSLKQSSASKPKGLSIRSKSDLNVSTPSQKTANVAKAKLDTLDGAMGPTTPHQKEAVSKPQAVCEKQLRSLSLTSKSPLFNQTIEQKEIEDPLFKKPVTPKNNERSKHVYPEPEQLAPYINEDFYLRFASPLDSPMINKSKVNQKTVLPSEDEGFGLDPESISPPINMSSIKSGRSNTLLPDIKLDAPNLPMMPDSANDF